MSSSEVYSFNRFSVFFYFIYYIYFFLMLLVTFSGYSQRGAVNSFLPNQSMASFCLFVTKFFHMGSIAATMLWCRPIECLA